LKNVALSFAAHGDALGNGNPHFLRGRRYLATERTDSHGFFFLPYPYESV
jgi:hypothetical protein